MTSSRLLHRFAIALSLLALPNAGFTAESPKTSEDEYTTPTSLTPEQVQTYMALLRSHIKARIRWKAEDPLPETVCEVSVELATDGRVLARRVLQKANTDDWCAAVLRAVDAADPMPKDPTGRVPKRLVIAFRSK
jgi:membrane protein involved in colicin uptake